MAPAKSAFITSLDGKSNFTLFRRRAGVDESTTSPTPASLPSPQEVRKELAVPDKTRACTSTVASEVISLMQSKTEACSSGHDCQDAPSAAV